MSLERCICPNCNNEVLFDFADIVAICDSCGHAYSVFNIKKATGCPDCLLEGFHVHGGYLDKYTGSANHVVIPNGIKKICERSFFFCSSIESVEIPDSVEIIAPSAFANAKNLKTVVWGKSIGGIGDYAFANTKISSAILPAGIVAIGNYAFMGCKNLEKLVIPKGIKSIGVNVVMGCHHLKVECPEKILRDRVFNPYGNSGWEY